MIGSLAAPVTARRASIRTVTIATAVVGAVLVPLLSILPGHATPGIVFGATWILNPVWSTVVGARGGAVLAEVGAVLKQWPRHPRIWRWHEQRRSLARDNCDFVTSARGDGESAAAK